MIYALQEFISAGTIANKTNYSNYDKIAEIRTCNTGTCGLNSYGKKVSDVYDNLLSSDGILIYHDINIDNIDDPFPNLLEILNLCKTKNIHHKLFNRSTKENERCHRGLLVIFKHKEIL